MPESSMWGLMGGQGLSLMGMGLPLGGKKLERAVSAENIWMNNASYMMWLARFLDIAISLFEYENLPEGIDVRQMELWLWRYGYVILFYDEALKNDPEMRAPEGYAVLPGSLGGNFDLYNLPNDRRVYAPNGFYRDLNEENSVVIWNNQLRTPEIYMLQLYARRIAEIDRTIDINVMNQKTPKVIRCDKSQQLTWKNIAAQAQGNVYVIYADGTVDLKDIDVMDLTVPFVGEDMDRLKRRYVSEAMTFLGVEGVDTDKKERLIGQEVLRGMGDVEAARFTRLNPREDGWDRANELFGLDVSVKFKSGIYIQGNAPTQYEPTQDGMQTHTGLEGEGVA